MDRADAFLNRALLRAVRRRLGPDATVRAWLQGRRAGRRGYLVATDDDVAWLRPRAVFGTRVEAGRVADLVGWEAKGLGRAGFVRLRWRHGDWAVDDVVARSAAAFCGHLEQRRTGVRSFQADGPDPAADEAQRQARVQSLRRKGLLQKDEADWMSRRRNR